MMSRNTTVQTHHGDTETRRYFVDHLDIVDEVIFTNFFMKITSHFFDLIHRALSGLGIYCVLTQGFTLGCHISGFQPDHFHKKRLFDSRNYITRTITEQKIQSFRQHKSYSLQDGNYSLRESPCLRVSVVNKNLGEVSRDSR
jgi:hypothetical protein